MSVQMKSKSIMEAASSSDNFRKLCAAVKAADLVEALQGEGPFTVFAPTDEAFDKLPEGAVDELLKPENRDKLVSILTYHVIPDKLMAADVVELSETETMNGQSVTIDIEGDTLMIDSARVIDSDIECSNGVIHVIDTVLTPE